VDELQPQADNEIEGIRIIGAVEAGPTGASTGIPGAADRSVSGARPSAGPSAAVPAAKPSPWEPTASAGTGGSGYDDDADEWDDSWLAGDGDLDLDLEPSGRPSAARLAARRNDNPAELDDFEDDDDDDTGEQPSLWASPANGNDDRVSRDDRDDDRDDDDDDDRGDHRDEPAGAKLPWVRSRKETLLADDDAEDSELENDFDDEDDRNEDDRDEDRNDRVGRRQAVPAVRRSVMIDDVGQGLADDDLDDDDRFDDDDDDSDHDGNESEGSVRARRAAPGKGRNAKRAAPRTQRDPAERPVASSRTAAPARRRSGTGTPEPAVAASGNRYVTGVALVVVAALVIRFGREKGVSVGSFPPSFMASWLRHSCRLRRTTEGPLASLS
jgi:hypothetical protein